MELCLPTSYIIHPDDAVWIKYVDPNEVDGENFEVYERTLAQLEASGYKR
jgi:hypothetical protein